MEKSSAGLNGFTIWNFWNRVLKNMDWILTHINGMLNLENMDQFLIGFGLGLERTVAWISGAPHVRETIPFPRLLNRLYP